MADNDTLLLTFFCKTINKYITMNKRNIMAMALFSVAFIFSSVSISTKFRHIKSLADFNIEALSNQSTDANVDIEIRTCTIHGTGWGFDQFSNSHRIAECKPFPNQWMIEGAYPCIDETLQDFGAPIYSCWDIVVR